MRTGGRCAQTGIFCEAGKGDGARERCATIYSGDDCIPARRQIAEFFPGAGRALSLLPGKRHFYVDRGFAVCERFPEKFERLHLQGAVNSELSRDGWAEKRKTEKQTFALRKLSHNILCPGVDKNTRYSIMNPARRFVTDP